MGRRPVSRERKIEGAAVSFARRLDPDLAAVVDAWPSLPEPIRAGIIAMVEATQRSEVER